MKANELRVNRWSRGNRQEMSGLTGSHPFKKVLRIFLLSSPFIIPIFFTVVGSIYGNGENQILNADGSGVTDVGSMQDFDYHSAYATVRTLFLLSFVPSIYLAWQLTKKTRKRNLAGYLASVFVLIGIPYIVYLTGMFLINNYSCCPGGL